MTRAINAVTIRKANLLDGCAMLNRFQLNQIFDIYEHLLTNSQREVFRLYYHNDISLGEIAEALSITRQAVHDLIKRTEKILIRYEDALNINKKNEALLKLANELEACSYTGNCIYADKLKQLIISDEE